MMTAMIPIQATQFVPAGPASIDLTAFCITTPSFTACEHARLGGHLRCELAHPDSITQHCWPCFKGFIAAVKRGDIEPSTVAALDDESREVLADASFDITPFGPWFLPSAAQRAALAAEGLTPAPKSWDPVIRAGAEADVFADLHDIELDRLGRASRKEVTL
jgi:hypothetical protein